MSETAESASRGVRRLPSLTATGLEEGEDAAFKVCLQLSGHLVDLGKGRSHGGSCLSVCLSINCLSVHQLSVCPSIVCLSINCLSVHQLSVCPSIVCLSINCLSVHQLSVCPSIVCLSINCLSVHQLSVCPSIVCLSINCLSVHQLSVCPSIACLSVCLSVCPSVCLSVHQSVHPSVNWFVHLSSPSPLPYLCPLAVVALSISEYESDVANEVVWNKIFPLF